MSPDSQPSSWGADEQRWAAWMALAHGGDHDAYRQLLGELANAIETYIRVRFGAIDSLEDCVQECLLVIHKARHTYDPVRPFRPWLFTLVRHRTIPRLRWGQVDFESRSITVDRAIKRADGGRPIGIGPTKTGNRRDVEMTELLLAALRRHRKHQAERRLVAGPIWTADPRWADLVFTSEVGTPVDPSHARRDFKKVCAHAGVPGLSLYEMRHTVASLMVDADVPLREVADLLGHKDLEMVVKRYRHRTDGVVKSHVAVLSSLTAP